MCKKKGCWMNGFGCAMVIFMGMVHADYAPMVVENTWIYKGRFYGNWHNPSSFQVFDGFEERLSLRIESIRNTRDSAFIDVKVVDSIYSRWALSSGGKTLNDTVLRQLWTYGQKVGTDSLALKKVAGDVTPHFHPEFFRYHVFSRRTEFAWPLGGISPRTGYAWMDTARYPSRTKNWYVDSVGLYWSYEVKRNDASCARAGHELFLESFNGSPVRLAMSPDTVLGYRETVLLKSARRSCSDIMEPLARNQDQRGANPNKQLWVNGLGQVRTYPQDYSRPLGWLPFAIPAHRP